ncbi:cytochrome P450 [Bacillus sp. Marseille-P3661]|uniref:cytochrome P450 n=1 Tax=Bacillus sp. Marseille-P3661 TaxID=1936234 RepID=UPI000C814AA7|nr:cytochrome P450 [Bacillus sp. Marseille-P3661]
MTVVSNIKGLQPINYLKFRRDPLQFLLNTSTLGDFVCLNATKQSNSYIVHSPDAVKEILTVNHSKFIKGNSSKILGQTLGNGLLTSEGKEHQEQRKVMQPAFQKQYIKSYAETVIHFTEDLIDTWKDGEERFVSQDMLELTLRIIVKTMFGIDIKKKLTTITKAVNDIIEKTAQSLLMPFPIPSSIPTIKNYNYKKGIAVLEELVDELLRSNQKKSSETTLLQLLQRGHERITRDDLRNQILTIVIAGHETTANVLTWMLLLLAQHPSVETQVHNEINKVISNRLPRFEDIKELTYTNQVFSETLRLYPPAWILLREAVEDVEIIGKNFSKQDTFLISPYVIQRNPAYFYNAGCFQPERFSTSQLSLIKNYSYFPFGAGPRGCIGSQFASMESILIIAMINQRFVLKLTDNPRKITPEPLVSLRIKNGLQLKILAK